MPGDALDPDDEKVTNAPELPAKSPPVGLPFESEEIKTVSTGRHGVAISQIPCTR